MRAARLAAASRAFTAAAAAAPSSVGILAAELYVPSRFVAQSALETADGVSAGKYTVGLGQTSMAFVDDREDINSIALTALARLLKTYGVDPRRVGRLEVGTESLVDKSKSTKTTLMSLLAASGNRDVEGATTLNACYGGTAALFNSAAWAASPEARGRLAVYVAADIAVYEAGPARPTGGAGAVAVLVGAGAPLALVPGVRTTHAVDAYDFYKPALGSEYPAVDGKLSQSCYLEAVDACYNGTMARLGAARLADAFDFMAFHSPYNKLVAQSFRRCLFNDARRAAAAGAPLPAALAALEPFARLPAAATLANRDLDKALAALGAAEYAAAVGPTEALSKAIGNSYAAALHANLLCLAAGKGEALAGKTVGAFSYGSGAIATMFALRGVAAAPGAEFTLDRIARAVDVPARLATRAEASPADFVAALKMREASYGRAGFVPAGDVKHVAPGAFYLKEVKAGGQRVYEQN